MLYNATNIEKIFDKKKTSGGLLSKKSKIYCVKLPGGDIQYLPDYQRSIAVDIRYVLFIIDKFAGATHLIEEMDIR